MCPEDTSPEAWKVYLEIQQRMTPGEKLARAFQCSAVATELAKKALRERFPDANEREIFLRFARLKLGAELFQKVYGDVHLAGPDRDYPALRVEDFLEEATRLGRKELLQRYAGEPGNT